MIVLLTFGRRFIKDLLEFHTSEDDAYENN